MPVDEPVEPSGARRGRRMGGWVVYLVCWLLLAVVSAGILFFNSSRDITVASHDAELRPTLTGKVVIATGPILPDLRTDSGSPLGVELRLGKTEVGSTEELMQRYAAIASQPEGAIEKVRDSVAEMALTAAVNGAMIGVVPILLWLLLGRRRRIELLRKIPSRQGLAFAMILVLVAVGLWAPWKPEEETVAGERSWMSLQAFIGDEISLPAEADRVEVLSNATTAGTKKLMASLVDTYDRSVKFYDAAEKSAADIEVRTPEDGETVVALISDRHDNIGMDPVAREVADRAGATAVFDAGDDTSTGSKWEAFSLDSVTAAFKDLDRWSVAGNHDNGSFMIDYMADQGWTTLDGSIVDGPGGGRLLGVDDPRSSGLGTWRDEGELTFDEVRSRLADAACEADEEGERVDTILVHDVKLASDALERGCVDLAIGGHLHVQEGPTAVQGENGKIGYSYTTGTTGGAAYAIALGSKLRRAAEITLLTYDEDGRPVGMQPVLLQTNGRFDVGDYLTLDYRNADDPVPENPVSEDPIQDPVDGASDGTDGGDGGDGGDDGIEDDSTTAPPITDGSPSASQTP